MAYNNFTRAPVIKTKLGTIPDANTGEIIVNPSAQIATSLPPTHLNRLRYPGEFLFGDFEQEYFASTDLVTNGDFADGSVGSTWSGSVMVNLAGWTNTGIHNNTNKFTISGGECVVVTDGSVNAPTITQAILVDGVKYNYSIRLSAAVSGTLKILAKDEYEELESFTSSSAITTYTGTFQIPHTTGAVTTRNLIIKPMTNSSFTIDDVVITPFVDGAEESGEDEAVIDDTSYDTQDNPAEWFKDTGITTT